MNPLQEHAHLFANGEFKAWIDYEKCSFDINGLASDTKELLLEPDLGWYLAKDCTLIARPISDMTDEEKQRFYEVCEYYGEDYDKYSHYKEWIIQLHKDDSYLDDNGWDEVEEMEQFAKNRPAFLYLLSIGVYPFDQSHFESGIVIDSTTL